MKKSFRIARAIRVPLDSQYDYIISQMEMGVEYDTDKESVMDDEEEFKQLEKSLDSIQRDMIERETGVTELPMDNYKKSIKRRMRLRRKE
jgi:hypothetical protein